MVRFALIALLGSLAVGTVHGLKMGDPTGGTFALKMGDPTGGTFA